jgi:hypothetical protein
MANTELKCIAGEDIKKGQHCRINLVTGKIRVARADEEW